MTSKGSAAYFGVMTDEAIMAVVCARSDQAAFGELMSRWQQRVQGLCLRMTGNLHDAEDAAQETFTRVFTARRQFRGGSMFSTWLWRIAINVARDMRRRRAMQQPESVDMLQLLPDAAGQPQEALACTEFKSDVCRALQDLPEELRTVVVLRHYQQLKFREISDVLDIPLGTVCSRMTEGLSRLGQALKQLDHG